MQPNFTVLAMDISTIEVIIIYVFVYFFDILKSVNDVVNEFVWVKVGLLLLIGTGILMTILTNFFQITHLRHWVKKTMGGIFKKDAHNKKEAGSVSQFQAMCTALAATIGTGNIAGVSAAIVLGDPVPYSGCGLLLFLV